MNASFTSVIDFFQAHYEERFGSSVELTGENPYVLSHGALRPDNGPRLFLHEEKTQDVIVLTHGYTDSPYYMQAIAAAFFEEGLNVVLPLLPGHGLLHPGNALEGKGLDQQWRITIDHAVETAAQLGERISIGGFSTGGALGLNHILRTEPPVVTGGLFLFSGAIGIGDIVEGASRSRLIQSILQTFDGALPSGGRDPYKYAMMPLSGGIELGQIINENNKLIRNLPGNRLIEHPVFAVHSTHDQTIALKDVLDFMKAHVKTGLTMVLTQNFEQEDGAVHHLEHGQVPLGGDTSLIPLEEVLAQNEGKFKAKNFELAYHPTANPQFDLMVEQMLRFFRKEVLK